MLPIGLVPAYSPQFISTKIVLNSDARGVFAKAFTFRAKNVGLSGPILFDPKKSTLGKFFEDHGKLLYVVDMEKREIVLKLFEQIKKGEILQLTLNIGAESLAITPKKNKIEIDWEDS